MTLSVCARTDGSGRFERLGLIAAQNYRTLRQRGITVRKAADTVIATFCIAHGIPLLYSDRDFDPFVKYLGLKAA
jgi:predicted nucleic acid-binding protein